MTKSEIFYQKTMQFRSLPLDMALLIVIWYWVTVISLELLNMLLYPLITVPLCSCAVSQFFVVTRAFCDYYLQLILQAYQPFLNQHTNVPSHSRLLSLWRTDLMCGQQQQIVVNSGSKLTLTKRSLSVTHQIGLSWNWAPTHIQSMVHIINMCC